MRGQYVGLACLLSIITGLILSSNLDGMSVNNSITVWFLFSIVSGMILNLNTSVPKRFEILKESSAVSGIFSLSILLRNLYRIIWSELYSDGNTVFCLSGSCTNPFLDEIYLLTLLIIFIFIVSLITIGTATFAGKILLQFTQRFFNLNPEVFERWKKVVLGATSFVGVIFGAIKSIG